MLDAGQVNRKLKYAVTTMLLLAASGLAWSISRSASPDATTTAQVMTASAISPMELMLQHRRSLPTENWDSF
jgi:hypothetical protein